MRFVNPLISAATSGADRRRSIPYKNLRFQNGTDGSSVPLTRVDSENCGLYQHSYDLCALAEDAMSLRPLSLCPSESALVLFSAEYFSRVRSRRSFSSNFRCSTTGAG